MQNLYVMVIKSFFIKGKKDLEEEMKEMQSLSETLQKELETCKAQTHP